uniref:DDE Tnp4 domain-containing protein n=1 Tax=Nicotiana tabacum TaxID=4097 RepID=A0A1S3X6S2_TOBAC
DCIGAIDGTHIRVKVSQSEAPKYRGRKDYPTQNVLAACTFDLKFTYVLAGREGTTSDSRIMKEALNKQDPLRIPEAFGVLKKRFPIIASSTEPSYGVDTQKLIIFACCILHNYLRGVDPDDWLLAEVDAELINDTNVLEEPSNSKESNEEFKKGEFIRDHIATDMWLDYLA